MTLDCARPTQFSVILTIHYNVGLRGRQVAKAKQ